MGTVSAVGFCVRITHPWSSDSSARRLRVDTASELLTPSEISTEQCPHRTLNCRPHAWEAMDGQGLSSNFLDPWLYSDSTSVQRHRSHFGPWHWVSSEIQSVLTTKERSTEAPLHLQSGMLIPRYIYTRNHQFTNVSSWSSWWVWADCYLPKFGRACSMRWFSQ